MSKLRTCFYSQLEKQNLTNLEDYQKEYDTFFKEIKAYFVIFRKTFYKEEFNP